MDLSKDDVLKILKIIDESGYNDVRLEIGDFKLHVQKQATPGADVTYEPARVEAPAPRPETRSQPVAATPSAPPPAASEEAIPSGMVAVRSPMLGTFYRAQSPGETPFVEVGSRVTPDDTVCLVEVMKLFSSIKAGVAGRVAKILVENGAMVEHAQLLMLVDTSGA